MQEQRKYSEGRPKVFKNGTKRVCISLPIELVEELKKLGGSEWIRAQIEKAIKKD